jgi:dTDP-4-dehydrorhamnose reductase
MLGSAFCARLSRLSLSFIGTDIDLDITDSDLVSRFAEQHGFTHIINCAAYTQVDKAEEEVARATAVNGAAPGYIGEAAARIAASVIHFSTDYVFDGRGASPYREEAACFPLNVYGKTKREGEERLLITAPHGANSLRRVYVVRTSWLFGENGPNFVRTMLNLMIERETLRVVTDQIGRPTYCGDLADASLALLGLSESRNGLSKISSPNATPSGFFHFANSGPVSWHGFASGILEIARDMGFPVKTTRIEPVETSEFPRPAIRPAFSVLATDRIESILGYVPRRWELAVREYLGNIQC